ncbi:MAG: c-type cytochrome [Steroidobacteraceae bacterium]
MRRSNSRCAGWLPLSVCAALAGAGACAAGANAAASANANCPGEDSGLTLPPGFCATVFADDIGHARHLVVAPNGVVYVNTWSGRYYGNDTPHAGGFLVALQDTDDSGTASLIGRFGETARSGGAGGTGIGLYKGALYAEINDKIVRYPLPPDSILPRGRGEAVVTGLPLGGDHPMHPFAIDAEGLMYVDVGSATNACQLQNRTPLSPGADPCTELWTRGGIWRYDAKRTNQAFSPFERYATGIRNAEGFAVDAAGHRLFVTQHGRDQLHANWPDLYRPEEEATQPAEELLHLEQGGDYGWPECYYDAGQGKLVLAPEYGGDGGKKIGDCAHKRAPIAAFPAHWAPNAMVFYDREQFPAHYRHGVFIAFHGSWDRAPYAQQGYNVVFQSLAGDRAGGGCEIFADGFAGAEKSPGKALHRPSGLAIGPDGALYVSDDVRGRIYRIVYRGGPGSTAAAQYTPCPSASAPAGPVAAALAKPPEGTHPDAGAAASVAAATTAAATAAAATAAAATTAAATTAAATAAPAVTREASLPPSITRNTVGIGDQIFHGQLADGACSACHNTDGSGTTLGPNLRSGHWLWSDGSYEGIRTTIREGVKEPKQYRAPMPPMGGTNLTPEQLSAVAAYVWTLSHKNP